MLDLVGFCERFFPPKIWPIVGFFGFIEKSTQYVSLNFVHNENWSYLLYSSKNPRSGKKHIPKISNKMLLANEIVGLLNQVCL